MQHAEHMQLIPLEQGPTRSNSSVITGQSSHYIHLHCAVSPLPQHSANTEQRKQRSPSSFQIKQSWLSAGRVSVKPRSSTAGVSLDMRRVNYSSATVINSNRHSSSRCPRQPFEHETAIQGFEAFELQSALAVRIPSPVVDQ